MAWQMVERLVELHAFEGEREETEGRQSAVG